MGSRLFFTALVTVIAVSFAAGGASAPGGSDVFVVSGPDRQIATVDLVSGQARRIATGFGAVWSPDGRSLAFSSGGNIFTVGRGGNDLQQLTRDPRPDGDPVWSPDGSRIAYLQQSTVGSGFALAADVMVMDIRSRQVTRLVRDFGSKRALEWSPDGSSLYYVASGPTGSTTDVVDVASGLVSRSPDGVYPTWSADGRRIAYAAYSSEGIDLTIADSDWSNPQVVLHVAADRNIGGLSWSPNGRSLVFSYGRQQSRRLWLEVLDISSHRVRELTRPYGHADLVPSWSPDGRWIAFAREQFGRQGVSAAAIRATGGRVRVFDAAPIGDDNPTPLWRPASRISARP